MFARVGLYSATLPLFFQSCVIFTHFRKADFDEGHRFIRISADLSVAHLTSFTCSGLKYHQSQFSYLRKIYFRIFPSFRMWMKLRISIGLEICNVY